MLHQVVIAAGWRVGIVPGLLSLLMSLSACKASEQAAALHQADSSQSTQTLQVKTVAADTGALVYELDQRRGALVSTLGIIEPGTMLVTLPWGEWDIIRTDPLRVVSQNQVSSSRGNCPLSSYAHIRFDSVPNMVVQGERIIPQVSSAVARPLILGPRFTIAESELGVVAKSTQAMLPRAHIAQAIWDSPAWMPSQAQTWFSELHVPPEGMTPVVDDNAFLDFAVCYLTHQPGLERTRLDVFGEVQAVAFANGQQAVLHFRGDEHLDAASYEIDRDVLRFGVIAAGRNIKFNGDNAVLSKRYFGLEVRQLEYSKSSYVHSHSDPTTADVTEDLIKRIAQTDIGWKLAILQFLFNDRDQTGFVNQIVTGSGQTVLIDHEFAEPLSTSVPCLLTDVTETMVLGVRTPTRQLLRDRRYAEFAARVRQHTNFRITTDEFGAVFNATQFYTHLYLQNDMLPQSLQRALVLVLDDRPNAEPIVRRYFRQWAELRGRSVSEMEETGSCVFFERLAWLSHHQRLPTEAEGRAIMNQCGIEPDYSCDMEFYWHDDWVLPN